jgi:hypothetical protein
MGLVAAIGYSFNNSHKRQHIYIAAVHQGELPKISGADAWHSRSKLLLRMESIIELRP